MFCSQGWSTCDHWKSSLCLSKSNSSSGPRWALGLCGITAPSFCSFCISSNGHLKHHFLRFHFKLKESCYRKWGDEVAGSLPAALRGSKQSATAISPKLGLLASPLHSGLEWALLLSSCPFHPNSLNIVSPVFFQLEYSCFTTPVYSLLYSSVT